MAGSALRGWAGPGTDGTAVLCSTGSPVQLIDYLGGSPDPGGTWSGPAAHPGTFDPASDAPGVYTYTIAGPPAASAHVTVSVHAAPNAGTSSSLTLCSNGAPVDLFAQLGGTPDPGGAWTLNGSPVGNTFTPGTSAPGAYLYTVPGVPPCADASASVTVAVHSPPSAGTSTTLTLCSNGAPVDLFAHLGGMPDPGGAWTLNGSPVGSTFTPGTSLPGAYLYTVPGVPPCADASATVTVSVNEPPNAGADASLSVCSNAAAVDLFAELGGTPDPGGVWTLNGSPVSNIFHPESSAPGSYAYVVNGTPPCANDTATVDVTVVAAPDAGNNRSIIVCSDAPAFAMLDSLGGTPDPGGTWSPSISGTFTPGTSAPGAYTYTVPGTAPCSNATAVLTITVRTAPQAGTDRAVAVCSDGATFNLRDSLGGTPDVGGTWTGPNGAHSGQFQPGSDPSGTYVYHVVGQAPCAPASATVTVTVKPAPDAGTSTSVVKCSNAPSFTLLSQLGGSPDPGGSWTGPGGVPFPSGLFVPGTTAPGTYTYTVAGEAPCTPAVSTVNVSIVTAPEPGISATHTVCSTGGSFALFPLLGGTPDVGGTWTGPAGPVPSGTFTPGTSPAGVYTYLVAGSGPCADASATVTVTVITAADAGSNGSVTLCSTSGDEDLFTHLNGTPDAGGSWTLPTPPGGTLAGGIYQPANPAHPAGAYTYTVTGTAPCPNVSATVTVVEHQAPRAGTDGNSLLCSTSAPFNMATVLGGAVDGGGSWLNATNGTVPATFTPGTTLPGVYRYVVPGLAPCANDTAQATIQVNTAPRAGTNGAILVCSDDPAVDLFALLGGSPDAGGTWKDPDNQPNNGSFIPAPGALVGGYTYTVPGLSPCPDASSVVTVSQHVRPDAGASATLALCSTDGAVNLFNSLGGTPDAGGTWTGPGGATSNGVFIPGAAGTFVYKYKVNGIAPCAPDSATVTVTVTQAPSAGTSDTLTICSGQLTVDLFDVLGGTPDLNGTWTELTATGRLSSHFFNPGTPTQLAPGTYKFQYTVPANGMCPGASATATVIIVPLLNAGTNGILSRCSSETQVNLFTGLGGTPQPGGEWIDLDGTGQVTGQYFNAHGAGAGSWHFRYKLTGALGCNSDSAVVTVNVTAAPNAGHEGFADFCSDGSPVSLMPYISPAQPSGTWRKPAPGNEIFSGTYDPATFAPGDYTYTVSGTGPCAAGVAVVHVTETPGANPGNPAVVTLCANAPSFNMTTALGGSPDATGTWKDPSNASHGNTFVPGQDLPGVYIYTVAGTYPCSNRSSSLTVNVNPEPWAGGAATTTVCENAPGFALVNLLNSPQVGTWYGPDLSPFPSGTYVPGTSQPGTYSYVVVGGAPCGADTGTVTVFEVAAPRAGRDTSVAFCLNDAAVPLVSLLGGPHALSGTWTGPAPSQAYFGGIFQPGTSLPGTYTYHVGGLPPCGNDSSTVTVSVAPPPNAGHSRSISVCGTAQPFIMVDSLGGSPDVMNGSWYRLPSGPASNGIFNPQQMGPGTYTYRYTVLPSAISPCGPAQSTLTVVVTAAPDAGNDSLLVLCSTSGNTALFPALGGHPQGGGTWSFNHLPHGGAFNPVVDQPGQYAYTVAGTGGCTNDTARVYVTVNPAPNAGCNGVLTICDDQAPVVLRTLLGCNPDLGGTWTLNGDAVSEIYIPAEHAAGVHTFLYTVAGGSPCGSATAQVTIIQNRQAHAGNDAATSACTDGPDIDMFPLLGPGADPMGNWIGAASVFDPQDHVAGTYQYRYVVHGDAPCVSDTAVVTVNLNRKPVAGISTAPQLCTDGPLVPLVNLLGGTPDANGEWTYVPTGGTAVPHGPVFDPASDPAGTYVYTVAGTAPCTSSSATVQIYLVNPPNAGLHGTVSACISETAVNLWGGLQGSWQTGGTWTDVDGTGELANGLFNASGVLPGTYHFRYTVAGVGPCHSDTASVAVTVTPELDAGADSSVMLCASETLFLTTLLGGNPQPGGTWTGIGSQAGLINGVLNAGQAGVGVHQYRYVLSGSANCAPDTAILTVTVMNGPQAGSDGNSTTCSSSGPIDLFLLIGVPHDANGTWYYPGTGGPLAGSTIDPAVDPSGAYRYIVPAIGDCAADTAQVNINVIDSVNAGLNGVLSFCSNGASQNLGVGLGGTPDPGGSWAFHPSSGPPVPHGPVYNPLTDVPGSYVYTVPGTAPCPAATATVTVTEITAPFAGDDNAVTLCSNEPSFAMIGALAGSPQSGGTWKRDGQPPVAHGPNYNPAVDSSGTFLYIRTGSGPCASDTARLAVVEVRAPQAGHDTTVQACPTDDAVNLFAALGPLADSTGVWTDSTGAVLADSLFDATQVPAGLHVFTYTVAGTAPCADAIATVSVDVGAGLDVGIGGNDTICGAQVDYNLFQSLGGTPDLTGVWSEQTGVGAVSGNSLNATLLTPGSSYPMVYTLSDSLCGQLQSVVLLYIAPYPNPGPDTALTLCSSDAAFPLGPLLSHADPGGTWTGPDGNVVDPVFDPATDPQGVYSYHLTGSAYCADTAAHLAITVNAPADAGLDGTAQSCNEDVVPLFPILAGSPQAGGTWTDLDGSGALSGGSVNAGQLLAGQYHFRYRVDVAGCAPDSAQVLLQIVDGVSIADLRRDCNQQDRTYTVSFTITGGSPSTYSVTGGAGTLSPEAPYVFTSEPIFTSQGFSFHVDDANHCTPQLVEGGTPCDFADAVFIPESFTPNGDHINDTFQIPGIEGYPDNHIVIFNRWGGEVYSASGYDNVRTVWDGSSPNALLPGNAATGTYYYVLDLGDGSETLKGFIYLNR